MNYKEQFTNALRAGDDRAAEAVVGQAQAAGWMADNIYFDIFAPSMVTIGLLWEQNDLTVAEEHLATAITERLIGQLSPAFVVPTQPLGTIVLGCVAGEQHALGLRMLADLLRRSGWRVLYLGADVPTEDWVKLAIRYNADAVAISASSARSVARLRELITALRAARGDLDVLVGGAMFDREPELWQTVGATLYDPDPRAAVARLTARYDIADTSGHS